MKRTVPFSRPYIGEEEKQAVTQVLDSGWLSRGPKCLEFEETFASYVGAKYAVSLSSCTAALHLALLAHGIGPGDKVAVPSMTFPATVNAILYVGATPVFIDSGEDYNYCPKHLESLRRRYKIKAVVGVDMHGLPCMTPDWSRFSNPSPTDIPFIRDAAHSLGATVGAGTKHNIGSMETTCFSFYATKNITTGDGGMLTTNDPQIAERVRRLSLHGLSSDAWKRYDPAATVGFATPELGYKYNMTDIQAAIGLVQLEKLDQMLQMRLGTAVVYNSLLSVLPSKLNGKIHTPPTKSVWHTYSIRVADRDRVAAELKARGIGVGIHFKATHQLPYLQKYVNRYPDDGGNYTPLPIATQLGNETLSLPLYPGMSVEDVEYVVSQLKEILNG